MREVIIERVDKSDESRNPRFRYHTELDGQTNYLKRRCDEKGIASVAQNRAVAIFAKRKIHEFAGAIKESLTYEDLPYPEMTGNSLVCKSGRSILGVFVKKQGVVHLFTTEKHFGDVKFHLYERRVPLYVFVKIFNSHREFVEHVQEIEHIII
jgi:hypothetical protein